MSIDWFSVFLGFIISTAVYLARHFVRPFVNWVHSGWLAEESLGISREQWDAALEKAWAKPSPIDAFPGESVRDRKCRMILAMYPHIASPDGLSRSEYVHLLVGEYWQD